MKFEWNRPRNAIHRKIDNGVAKCCTSLAQSPSDRQDSRAFRTCLTIRKALEHDSRIGLESEIAGIMFPNGKFWKEISLEARIWVD